MTTQPEPPKCFGYVRVSTYEQESGTSPETQRTSLDAYYHYALRPDGFAWAGYAEDVPCSGMVRFLERPAGKELWDKLRPGDCVVFSKLDRGFRSASDFVVTFDRFMERGIHVQLLDMRVDTRTPVGKMVAGILAHVSEFERQRFRERTEESRRARRAAGQPIGGRPPYGFKTVTRNAPGGRKRKAFLADREQRATGRRIVHLREDEGLTFRQIVFRLKCEGVVSTRTGRPLPYKAVYDYYQNELSLQARERNGNPNPYQ
jgi:DNA invertase Pin-like site-specific DNA recombinase